MLPESLQENLKRFEKRLFVVESIVSVCGGLLGILISFLLLFVSDRFWDTPVPVRFLVTVTGCVVFALAALWWARYWLVRRRDTRALARMVQHGMGGIGDRLLGAVELAEGENVPKNISPALTQAAIAQVSEQMKKYDFSAAVERKKSRMLSLTMLLCAVIICGLIFFVPSAFRNSLLRWGKPIASVPRYTFTSIEDLPAQKVVPHGEPFKVAIKLASSTIWRPEKAVCRIEDQPEIEAKIDAGMAEFDLPGQVVEGDLTVRLGDVRKTMRILPMFRPELVDLQAQITMPEYLGYTGLVKHIDAGTCEVLEGSDVSLVGTASRELSEVLMKCGERESPVEPEGAVFKTPYFESSAGSNCTFRWQDIHGLEARQPYTVRCVEVKDRGPSVECRGIGRSIAILEDEVVKIEAFAADDFGLKDLRLNWSISGKDSRTVQEELLAKGGTKVRMLDGKYMFSPVADNVPEESVVTLYAAARDYRPGAGPEVSVPHRIFVLSKATHAKLMQEMMERVQNRIDDLVRQEKELKKNNEALSQMEAGELKSSEGSEKTRRNEYVEREHARKLDDIEREMKDLTKELMRNSEIDPEAVKNWAEMTDQMQQIAENEMSKAVQSMRQASGDPSERKENLDKAIKAEEELISKLQENAKKMGETLENMLARNFINRLKQLAALQAEIGTTAKEILPKSVGLSKDELPAEVSKAVGMQEEKQTRIRKEAGYIYDDLGGYYNRTRKEVYDAIRRDMVTKQTQDELGKLRMRITANLSVSVIEGSTKWSAQFKEWAKMLQDDSGGEGEGEGEQDELSPEDIEVLIALMRMRQAEETLREQTRLLEERKAGNMRYASDARKLAGKQGGLDSETLDLQRKVKHKKLKQLLEKIDGEMLNCEVYLKRPQTDQETVAIQTEIIELLSSAMSECKSGSSASMMLMMSMGMQPGGGSYAGGTTDRSNIAYDGNTTEQSYEARTVETVGGVDEEWPAEFKDALEGYYRALEER